MVPAQKAVSVKACFDRIRKIRFWNLGCLELDFIASSLLKTRGALEMGLDNLQVHFLLRKIHSHSMTKYS